MKNFVAIALGVGWCAFASLPSSAEQPVPIKRGMALVSEPVLYYETAGQGPAVVLIHGGNLDRRMWDDQFQEFAKHFQVIRYDVRTYGWSRSGNTWQLGGSPHHGSYGPTPARRGFGH